MAETKVLKMSFLMQGNKKSTITLADPKDGLTRPEVNAAMSAIVDGSVLQVDGLDVVSADDAYIYSTNKITIPDE